MCVLEIKRRSRISREEGQGDIAVRKVECSPCFDARLEIHLEMAEGRVES